MSSRLRVCWDLRSSSIQEETISKCRRTGKQQLSSSSGNAWLAYLRIYQQGIMAVQYVGQICNKQEETLVLPLHVRESRRGPAKCAGQDLCLSSFVIHADVQFWGLRWCCGMPQQMDDAGKGILSQEALRSMDGLLGNLQGGCTCVQQVPSLHRAIEVDLENYQTGSLGQ